MSGPEHGYTEVSLVVDGGEWVGTTYVDGQEITVSAESRVAVLRVVADEIEKTS